MSKKLITLFVLTGTLILIACSADEPTTSTDPTEPSTVNVTYSTAPTIDDLEPVSISIDWLDELPDDYVEWVFPYETGSRTLVITPSQNITDFAIIDVYPHLGTDRGMEILGVMFYAGDLGSDRPFVIQSFLERGGSFPRTGLTFVDETGTRRFFTFMESPMDGAFHPNEFEYEGFEF